MSNKLTKVTDNGTLGVNNGALGDFKDGTNGADDYVYDDNGNLIVDLNKNALNATGGKSTPLGTSGIIYNYLDKPETINITGKGAIKILYDADGNKLQRTFIPASGTAKVTTYINEFVYQGDVLQYINFEEGRIRVLTSVSQNNGYDGLAIDGNIDLPPSPVGVGGGRGAYDYFIRDYQQNVRMILTEETHYGINQCTMEAGREVNEEPYFGQPGTGNEVAATRFAKPPGWNSNTSSSVSKLSKLTGHTIGPNSLLKVMAGDVLNATTDYYYPGSVTNNNNSLVTDIVAALVNAISGSRATPTSVHGNTGNISTDLNASAPFASITDPDRATGDQIPRAYLNIIFFNERFEFVEEGSTALRVSQSGDNAAPLVLSSIKAPKNGYAYIYVSNENDDAVYFDNFTVSDTRGRIIEEDHYYAFGLKIAGISSVKFGDEHEGMLANKNLYNDKELFDDADLNWYDYGFRNYDAQIGRFPQLDPLTWDYPELTNYQYASNEPILNIDLDGLEGLPTPGGWWNGSYLEIAKTSSHIGADIGISTIKIGADIASSKITSNNIQSQIKNSYTIPLTGIGASGALEGAGPFALIAGGYQIGWNYGETHADKITNWVTSTAAWISKTFGLDESKPIAAPVVHANRKDNPNEHIVYNLYGVTSSGKKVLLKYGISDYTRYKEKRPRSQTSLDYVNNRIREEYKGLFKKITYSTKHFNNRFSALAEELRLVSNYYFTHKRSFPPLQKRPAPMSYEEWLSTTEY